jgi:hypothetical protein
MKSISDLESVDLGSRNTTFVPSLAVNTYLCTTGDGWHV